MMFRIFEKYRKCGVVIATRRCLIWQNVSSSCPQFRYRKMKFIIRNLSEIDSCKIQASAMDGSVIDDRWQCEEKIRAEWTLAVGCGQSVSDCHHAAAAR